MNRAIYVSNFFICYTNNVLLEYSEKKYCADVDLRDDTNWAWPLSPFCQKGWDGHALVISTSPQKDTHTRKGFMLFSIISTTYWISVNNFLP